MGQARQVDVRVKRVPFNVYLKLRSTTYRVVSITSSSRTMVRSAVNCAYRSTGSSSLRSIQFAG